jgi:hypothetical protein
MSKIFLSIALLIVVIGCKDNPRKETFVVDGQSVNATTAIEDNYESEISELTNEQKDFLERDLDYAKQLVSKYLKRKVDNPFDAKILDEVLEKWRESTGNRESVEEIVDAIGAAFGQGIVDGLDFEWKILTDQYGIDRVVIDKKYFVNGFPYVSVEKIVSEENPRSLEDIRLILKCQVQEAERTGEAALRE